MHRQPAKPFRPFVATALVMIILLGILTSCLPITRPPPSPSLTPTAAEATAEPTKEPTEEPTKEPTTEPTSAKTEEFWVKNQVILTGPADEVERMRQLIAEQLKVELEPIPPDCGEPCQLGQFFETALLEDTFLVEQFLITTQRNNLPSVEQARSFILQLFGYKGDIPVEQLVNFVNQDGRRILDSQVQGESFVFADPNYLLGPSGNSNCASPHTIGSTPHTIGSTPFAGMGLNADPNEFGGQVALQKMQSPTSTVPGEGGNGVVVAIFDTSSFSLSTSVPTPVEINWVLDKFTLNVEHASLIVPVTPTVPLSDTGKEHGLFVAGLVHALAPNSELRLIRVLNDYGCGELATLSTSLTNFASQMRSEGRLSRFVVNLSLGVHKPISSTEDNEQIVALGLPLLWGISAYGGITVAASGNDSSGKVETGQPLIPTQRPASFAYVVGVAASTVDDKRACYSNPGSIAAPGGNGGFQDVDGDGLPDDVDGSGTVENVEHCLSQSVLCADGQCTTGVISVVTTGTSSTGYGYWSGSSFSTALVSGLVATGISNGCAASGLRAKLLAAALPASIPAGALDAGSLGAGVAQASFICP